jgi:hypothetical protein
VNVPDGYDHRKILNLASDVAPGYFVAEISGSQDRIATKVQLAQPFGF